MPPSINELGEPREGEAIPRYAIEGVYDSAVQEDIAEVSSRSKRVGMDAEALRLVADDMAVLPRGSEPLSGCGSTPSELGHMITNMYEIAADVTPADFAG